MILPLLLAAAVDDASLIQIARARLAAEHRCMPSTDDTDVTVCGLRDADRFRVPFVADPGDPRFEGVSAERHRLLHRTTPIDELTPFLVGGGMAGVTATVGTGAGGTGPVRVRKPAP